jgi:hypothetical protein
LRQDNNDIYTQAQWTEITHPCFMDSYDESKILLPTNIVQVVDS